MSALIHSPAWLKTKVLLKSDRDDLLRDLVMAKGHDESNLIRGRIQQIDDILERYPIEFGTKTELDD